MAAVEGPPEGGDRRSNAELSALVAEYSTSKDLPPELIDLPILLLVGPSGAGKDSVKRELLKTGRYYELVSHTTREPRTNDGILEIDGCDYHFVSLAHMAKMARARKFLQIKCYGINYYGTSIDELFKAAAQNSAAVTDVNIYGAAEFAKLHFNHISTMFLLPPTLDAWIQRLQHRQSSSRSQETAHIAQRLTIAVGELEYAIANADQMAVVVNDNLSTLVRKIDVAMTHGVGVKSTPDSLAVAKRLLFEIRCYLEGFGL